MKPEQREELKQAAKEFLDIDLSTPMRKRIALRESFAQIASPEAIISLIAQVEALTVPQWISVETEPKNDTAVIVLFWPYGNKENTQIAQSARYFDGSFIDEDGNEMHPPSHWMPFAFPTIPAIPGTKEGA